MFRKPINTLLKEELKTLLMNNEELREKLYDRAMNDAGVWVEEYLHGLNYTFAEGSINYGYSYGDYFKIKDDAGFIEWANNVNKMYCFFSDDENNKLKEFARLSELYKHCEELYYYGFSPYTGKYGGIKEKDYYNVLHQYDDARQELQTITLNRLRADFDYLTEYRRGESEKEFYYNLFYDFYDLIDIDFNNCFTDHELKNIYEGTPGYYTPARIINIPAHAEYIPAHREPDQKELVI